MQLLADMKPAFLRFPGGNYLEGNTIATRFDWKKTIGDISGRPGHMNDAWRYCKSSTTCETAGRTKNQQILSSDCAARNRLADEGEMSAAALDQLRGCWFPGID